MGACSNDVLDLGTVTTTNNANAPRGFVSMDQAKARLANIVNQLNSQTSDASQRYPAVTPSRLTGVALGADLPEDSVDTGGGYNIYRIRPKKADF